MKGTTRQSGCRTSRFRDNTVLGELELGRTGSQRTRTGQSGREREERDVADNPGFWLEVMSVTGGNRVLELADGVCRVQLLLYLEAASAVAGAVAVMGGAGSHAVMLGCMRKRDRGEAEANNVVVRMCETRMPNRMEGGWKLNK